MLPSRWFSSTLISSSSRARNLEDPLIFNEDYTLVTDWYNVHRSNGATTIHRMQLRKEYAAPAYHEYVLVLTRAGRTYRVDRGRDGPVLDTMKEQGVPPCDTIAPLQLTSWEGLNRSSYCMIELYWGRDKNKNIDLLLILDICFQIHNKSGKRYKLLSHNCYFFAETIIMIAARKTVDFRADLRNMLKGRMCAITWKSCWDATVGVHGVHSVTVSLGVAVGAALGRQLGKELGRTLEQQLGTELGQELGQHLGQELGRQLGQELERQLGKYLGQELEWEMKQQQMREREQGRDRDREQKQEWQWRLELERQQQWELYQDLQQGVQRIGCWNWRWRKQKLEQRRKRELEMEKEMERRRELWKEQQQKEEQERQRRRQHGRRQKRKRLWKLLQERLRMLEPVLERELRLAHEALVVVLVLALNGDLKPGWHKQYIDLDGQATKTTNVSTNMWYVKTECCRSRIESMTCFIRAKWLIANLGKIVTHKMKEEPLLGSSFSDHVKFPGSFSVSAKISVSCYSNTLDRCLKSSEVGSTPAHKKF